MTWFDRLNWVPGRQTREGEEPNYFKYKLAVQHWPRALSPVFNTKGGFDCYLLRYRPNYVLADHRDEVSQGLSHYRLNVVLSGKGDFRAEKTIVNLFGRVVLFRPDLYTHGMTNGDKERVVFSLGVAI